MKEEGRGIRFAFDLASQFFLSFWTFLHTLLINSVTVKARATKFKIPRPILPGKGSVLFLALCDLAPLPWQKVATYDVKTIMLGHA